MARLQEFYKDEVVPRLTERFQYASRMQVPHLKKVTLNMGVGEAIGDKKILENATADLDRIGAATPILQYELFRRID